jgi:type IV conjugative transfer system protein TraL
MKHYPYLDKDLDIAGLEFIDVAIIFAVSIVLLFVGLFMFNMVVGFLLFVSSFVILYIHIRRLKQNKERGYLVRRIAKLFRGNNDLY